MDLQAFYKIGSNQQPKTEQNIQHAEQLAQQPAAQPEEWVSLQETARRAGLHVQTLRRYVREGFIPYNQPRRGCAIRIEWNAFQSALAKSRDQQENNYDNMVS